MSCTTVPVIWNWKNRCILGVFVTQKFCLHELWNLLSLRMCPKAFLTHKLWEIWNSSSQSWEIGILRKQDWCNFAQFQGKMLKIKQKCLKLVSLKLQFLKIGLMNFGLLKACWSRRLCCTFWSLVGFTIYANKNFVSQNVPKLYCLSSFIIQGL